MYKLLVDEHKLFPALSPNSLGLGSNADESWAIELNGKQSDNRCCAEVTRAGSVMYCVIGSIFRINSSPGPFPSTSLTSELGDGVCSYLAEIIATVYPIVDHQEKLVLL